MLRGCVAADALHDMVLDPILGRARRGRLPLLSLEGQILPLDKLAQENRPQSPAAGLVAAVDGAHEIVALLLGFGLGHAAATGQRVVLALAFRVVIENYPSLCLSAPHLLEAAFLKTSLSQADLLCYRSGRFGVAK